MVANELETRGSVMGQDRVRFPPLPLLKGQYMTAWTCEDVTSLPPVEEAKEFVAYITPDGIWWVLSSVFTNGKPLEWAQLCRSEVIDPTLLSTTTIQSPL